MYCFSLGFYTNGRLLNACSFLFFRSLWWCCSLISNGDEGRDEMGNAVCRRLSLYVSMFPHSPALCLFVLHIIRCRLWIDGWDGWGMLLYFLCVGRLLFRSPGPTKRICCLSVCQQVKRTSNQSELNGRMDTLLTIEPAHCCSPFSDFSPASLLFPSFPQVTDRLQQAQLLGPFPFLFLCCVLGMRTAL